jgi:DNA-binding PadR family transcriptional regulator
MGRDVKRMMNVEIENVQQLHQEMKGVLHKADDKLEETTRKLEDSFENVITEVSVIS